MADQPCPHCGQPTPEDAHAAPYCCVGCRAAHALLQDAGLERFYDLQGADGVPVGELGASSWLWLEPLEAAAARAAEREDRGGVARLDLDVQGIHCAACVWVIETLFRRQPGARDIEVNPGLGRLRLRYEVDTFPLRDYLERLARLGYRTGPALKRRSSQTDGLLARLGVSAAIAMNSMILSAAVYFGLSEDAAGIHTLFAWVNLALGTLAVLVGGPTFFRGAWQGLRAGVLHLDVPISLGIVLAYAGSVYLFFSGHPDDTYFDTLCAFITLMLAGRFLQGRMLDRNRQRLLADSGVEGLHVRAVDARGHLVVAPVTEIVAGTTLVLAPGELLPVDARLMDEGGTGGGAFDLAWINGESEALDFTSGALVPAGAHLRGRRTIRLEAASDFSSSALRDLLGGDEAADVPPKLRGFWHRVSQVYVAGVLVLAAGGFVAWLPAGELVATSIAVAVLVVTCPCALGLATPLAYEMAHAGLRRKGFFLRRGDFFERALSVRKVLLDKTGTLTMGTLGLRDTRPLDALDDEARDALRAMVARSNHPKSRALFAALGQEAAAALPAGASVEERPGEGLTLTTAAETTWTLGAASAASAAEGDTQAGTVGDAEVAAAGEVALRRDGQEVARFAFEEQLRHDAARQVDALQAAGYEVWLVSGDDPARARAVGEELGLAPSRVRGGLSPADKASLIRELDEHDTLMVGDGINDAPAFRAAWCAGTPAIDRPALPARADFYLVGSGLGPVAEALAMTAHVRRTVVRNLWFAVVYNVAGIGLALTGALSPLVCAVAMPTSSVTVIGLTAWSFRSNTDRGKRVSAPQRLAPVEASR